MVNVLRLLLGGRLRGSAIAIKKTFIHPKRDERARVEFIRKIGKIPFEKLVFLDESGIEDNATPVNGWSLKGERCYGKKSHQHTGRVSMIAGLCDKKIIAPVVFEGTANSQLFETYVSQVLIKELNSGQTVVMDNISFHKKEKIKELIESVGANILFLPTYSPDLNPIENHWFRIKHHIRKVAVNFPNFFEAVAYVMSIP